MKYNKITETNDLLILYTSVYILEIGNIGYPVKNKQKRIENVFVCRCTLAKKSINKYHVHNIQ